MTGNCMLKITTGHVQQQGHTAQLQGARRSGVLGCPPFHLTEHTVLATANATPLSLAFLCLFCPQEWQLSNIQGCIVPSSLFLLDSWTHPPNHHQSPSNLIRWFACQVSELEEESTDLCHTVEATSTFPIIPTHSTSHHLARYQA